MRDKFSELIEQGVAKFEYTPIAPELPEQDPICMAYNNIWSIPSDTHMHMNHETGERYITGHMIKNEKDWNKFVCAYSWGAVNFRTTGYWSLCDFLQKHSLCGHTSVLNGDVIYLVNPIEVCPEEHEYCGECPTSCCTTESRIPQPIAVLTNNFDSYKVIECFKDKKNLYDVANALNESYYVKGTDWTVNGNNLMCFIGNKVYVL